MSHLEEFVITLSSNVINEFESNTISNFQTLLSQRKIFPQNEKWKVGLREITFPKTWYNVQNATYIRFFDQNVEEIRLDNPNDFKPEDFGDESITFDDTMSIKILIKPGHYDSIEALIENLNEKLNIFKGNVDVTPKLEFDKITSKVRLRLGTFNKLQNMIIPYFGKEIEMILGFFDDNNESFQDHLLNNTFFGKLRKMKQTINKKDELIYFVNAPNVTKLNDRFQNFFIYTNIVEYSSVSNTSAQLLGTVSIDSNKKYGDVIRQIESEPSFKALQTTNFDIIEIDVKDDSNKSVKFNSGRVLIHVAFRRYE